MCSFKTGHSTVRNETEYWKTDDIYINIDVLEDKKTQSVLTSKQLHYAVS